MKIKLLTGLSDGVTCYKPQSVVEWDTAEANRMILDGIAVATDDPPTAAASEPAPAAEDPKPKKKGK